MPTKLPTPKGQPRIASYMKKRSHPQRINSPTNQTSSPDQKRVSVDPKPNMESTSNEPGPMDISPQRDKNGVPHQATDVDMEQAESVLAVQEVNEQGRTEEHTKNGNIDQPQKNTNKTDTTEALREGNNPNDKDVGTEAEKVTHTPADTPEPQKDNEEMEVQKEDDRRANEAGSNSPMDGNPKLKSSLKHAFADVARRAADLPTPAPIIPKWEAHRFACMFDIKMPKDKSKRTEYIATELNKMMDCLREYSKVYIRKYSEYHMPRNTDKTSWISKYDKKKVSDLTSYTFGFYYYQALREGTFRLLIQLILPVGTNIPDLLINANGHKWAGKNNRSIRDIREQNLHSPKYVGWLFRSNYSMVGSNDLQNAFENRAGIHFGLTFKSVPLHNQGAYNKETAVKAICISCNEADQQDAWNTLMTWYNSEKPTFPLGIPMMFIPSKDHPDIKNNPAATQNISTLLDRQRIFLRDTDIVTCPHLAFPDAKEPKGRTLRHELMDLTAVTMGNDNLGAKLFHSITRKVDPKGEETYQMTFHKSVAREALSIISGMGQFIKKELQLDAEYYCHPHLINDEHDWDKEKRCVINPTTTYISNLAILAGTDEQAPDKVEKEEYSMDTKGRRESRRIKGQDGEETIQDITKKKKARQKSVPGEVQDDKSMRSEMSDLTRYSSSTRASNERKQLRRQLDDQQEELDEKDNEIARLKAKLAQQSLEEGEVLSNSDHNSGEDTAESPPIPPRISRQEKEKERYGDWNFDEIESDSQEKDMDVDIEVTGVRQTKKKKQRSDGLIFVFRGPPKQVKAVAEYYTEQGETTVQTLPYRDGTTTKVDLYKVIDKQKFKNAQNSQSHSVKFAKVNTVQEYDTRSGKLKREVQTVDTPSSPDMEDKSVSSSSSKSSTTSGNSHSDPPSESSSDRSSSESSSSSSNYEPTPPRESKKSSKKRATSISKETLNQAKDITNLVNDNESDGNGPNSDE